MATKKSRPDLSALDSFGTPAPKAPPAAAPASAPASAISQAGYRAPSREGKRALQVHVDPATRAVLKGLCAEQDRSVQDLLSEAINLLFQAHGKPPIA